MRLRTGLAIGSVAWVLVTAAAAPSRADRGLSVAGSHAGNQPAYVPGFVVLAQHRFDPMIQRWLAEDSLKALPIGNGQLFYIIPVDTNPLQEQLQIRYLEEMLSRQPVEPGSGQQ